MLHGVSGRRVRASAAWSIRPKGEDGCCMEYPAAGRRYWSAIGHLPYAIGHLPSAISRQNRRLGPDVHRVRPGPCPVSAQQASPSRLNRPQHQRTTPFRWPPWSIVDPYRGRFPGTPPPPLPARVPLRTAGTRPGRPALGRGHTHDGTDQARTDQDRTGQDKTRQDGTEGDGTGRDGMGRDKAGRALARSRVGECDLENCYSSNPVSCMGRGT